MATLLEGYSFYELPRQRVRELQLHGYLLHAFPATDTVAVAVPEAVEGALSTYSRESAIVKTHLDWWADHFQDMDSDYFVGGVLPDEA